MVSIIIPSFLRNHEQARLLDETLETVAAQAIRDLEVILVDDGSDVEVEPIARRHPGTRTVRQPNSGSAVARNTGIAQSRGEFLVFLDGDDHLLPEALETGLAALEAHRECGFAVGPREEMTFEGDPVPWTVAPPPQESDIYLSLLAFRWYIIPPSSAMFRREVVEAVGGFRDPWGADDLDFYLRVARDWRAWCYQAPAVTRYRRYSASSSRDGARMLDSVRAVYARQWPLVEGEPGAEAAYHQGLAQLTAIFLDSLVENVEDALRAGQQERATRAARRLEQECRTRAAQLRGREPGLAALLLASGRM